MKRIIVANDLVGVGKVALSASIPLMASCLLEQVLLPTCSNKQEAILAEDRTL